MLQNFVIKQNDFKKRDNNEKTKSLNVNSCSI